MSDFKAGTALAAPRLLRVAPPPARPPLPRGAQNHWGGTPGPNAAALPLWPAAVPESPGAGGPTQGPPLLSGLFAGPGSVGREVPGWAPLLGLQLPVARRVLQECRFLALITRWRGG